MNTMKKFRAIVLAAGALATILLALGFIFLGLWTMRSSRENLSALSYGERTTGTIISKELGYDYYIVDSVTIKYTFTPSSGQELVDIYQFRPIIEKYFEDLHVGDLIEIAYDKQDPTINLPVRGSRFEETDASGVIWFTVVPSSLFFGFVTFFLGRSARKAWRLSKDRVS
jgi:hypothetical protein